MVVFTFDSVDLICSMLLTVNNIEKAAIFYNDGKKLCKVVGFDVVNDDFEVNGMSVEYERQYVLTLLDGSTLRVRLIGDTMVVES